MSLTLLNKFIYLNKIQQSILWPHIMRKRFINVQESVKTFSSFNNNNNNNKSSKGKLYYWNDVLFSSSFNEIVRLENINIDVTQYSLFREKSLIKSFDKGFFSLMPFVVRALERLVQLIDDQMYKLGAHKVLMPSMVGKHLWLKSGRWDLTGQDIFRVKDRHQMEYCLAPTHEEIITQVATCSQLSHRQLPIYLYQITPKYRDELRTKFGLLRAREFIMKDLYTFDKDEDNAKNTYQLVCQTYEHLFKLLELPIVQTVGSVGTIGGKYSHEFLLETNLGEDELITCLDCQESFNAELLDEIPTEQNNHSIHCLNCKSQNLTPKRKSLELGHSFLLSDRYSSKLGACYMVEHSNKPMHLQMGCYGLGVSRILAASVEYLSNKYQIGTEVSSSSSSSSTSSSSYNSPSIFLRWPRLIVPFKICLIIPKRDSKEDHSKGTEFSLHLANILCERFNEDVLIDDRSNLTIGKRLLTAKSIGIPFIIVAGRNIIDHRPKFEVFDMYKTTPLEQQQQQQQDPDKNSNGSILMTQAQLLNYLNDNLNQFKL